jgi:hypothetical protein
MKEKNLHGIDVGILSSEISETIAEFWGFFTSFSLDLTSKGAELINILRSLFFFDSEKLYVEGFLRSFREESNKELGCLEYITAENEIEETLVVDHAFWGLMLGETLLGGIRERGYNTLGVSAEKIITQSLKVGVEAFDRPFHGISLDSDHLRLCSDVAANRRSNVLVKSSDDASRAKVAGKDCIFCNLGLASLHHRLGTAAVHSLVKQLGGRSVHTRSYWQVIEASLIHLLLEVTNDLLKLFAGEKINIGGGA